MNEDSTNRITVTVDGQTLRVQPDRTILEALTAEGVHIPSLCHDIRLTRSNGNCGLCVVEVSEGHDGATRDVKACQTPVTVGMVVATHTPKLEAYRRVRLEQMLSDHNADCVAPCVSTCPAGIDIQGYLRHVVDSNFEAAIRTIKDRNPFPSVCGRVCPHPCEAACRRNLVDTPVAINHVKRFVSDWDAAQPKPWTPVMASPTGKRIAVVGAGPSGLTAAYYSAMRGHAVSVYERQPKPGGMMRYGIPSYRLPDEALDRDIDAMRRLGVEILTEKSLGTQLRLEDLRDDYDAVYLAIGSWQATPLHIEGENLPGVWLGINFLKQVTDGAIDGLSGVVVVIGGGNTAVDCARTALRLGAEKVQLLYRRTREEMPAEAYEIEEALAEHIEMVFLAAPTAITLDAETGEKLVNCTRMELGEPDRSGRRRPVPVEGSDFTVRAATVVGAIGQSTNTQFLFNDLPVQRSRWGDVEINGRTMCTSESKVFAGGDCVTGPATVIQAVAAGRRAADAMHEFLTTGAVTPACEPYSCSRGSLEDLDRHDFEECIRIDRVPMPALEVADRVRSFVEVEAGIEEIDARMESARCLCCGCRARHWCNLRDEATAHGVKYMPPLHTRPYLPLVDDHQFIRRDHTKCISCGRCVAACAEVEGVGVLAFQFRGGQLTVGTHDGTPLSETECVSCGQCVNVCPCGALDYVRERPKVFMALHDPSLEAVVFIAPAVRTVIADKYGLSYDMAAPWIAGALRRLGFDRVFDFSFAADLTVMEETTEFLDRTASGGVLPQFTSCCPGWVNFVENRYPGLVPHLSSCKSPQQMMGATVKQHFGPTIGRDPADLFVVSLVPCMAKKFEAARPEFSQHGVRDVDAVITTSEFFEMLDMMGLDSAEIEGSSFDDPYRQVSGAGVIFAHSGGVASAAMRMAVQKLTGEPFRGDAHFSPVQGMSGVREATISAGDVSVRIAVVSGLGHVDQLVSRVLAGEDVGYDLIEVMACPGGCINGAGHPVPDDHAEVAERRAVIFNIDKTSSIRTSQNNPDILRLYEDFYGEPGSNLAHELLHTTYRPRQRTPVRD